MRHDWPLPLPLHLAQNTAGPLFTQAGEEMKARLQEQHRRAPFDDNCLWQLIQICLDLGQLDQAWHFVEKLFVRAVETEVRSACLRTFGQIMELRENFAVAVVFYREALSLIPGNPAGAYSIQTNLAFSLNALGHHDEAEHCCRAAIALDPSPAAAWRHLGLALEGQNKWSDAADAFLHAIDADPGDLRPRRKLEHLLHQHPDLRRDLSLRLHSLPSPFEYASPPPPPVL